MASNNTAGGRTAYEKFAMEEVHRAALKSAPYNPRQLSEKAREHLKRNIKQVGLIQPVIWNKRTGNIVGGHQRLAILDAIEGTGDYRLTVAVVDLDEKTEKEQNVFLNNTNAMGDWDLPKLQELFQKDGIDALLSGFDMAEVYQLFGDAVANTNNALAETLSAQVKEARARYENIQKSLGKNRDNEEFYCVVVFKDNDERTAFNALLKLEDNRYLDGKALTALVRSALAAAKT